MNGVWGFFLLGIRQVKSWYDHRDYLAVSVNLGSFWVYLSAPDFCKFLLQPEPGDFIVHGRAVHRQSIEQPVSCVGVSEIRAHPLWFNFVCLHAVHARAA